MSNDCTRQIAIAVYTVNRHAKTATDNKHLYELKKMTLDKLIHAGKAKKIGLHFSENTKFSQQHSTTLVQCRDFLFHTIPEKEDFQVLPHLGHQNLTSRNPQERMSLRTAKNILYNYVGYIRQEPEEMVRDNRPKRGTNRVPQTGFRSSYLDG